MYAKEKARRAKSKRASKYKDTMPAQIVEMFSQGGTAASFCAHHKISQRAFDDWKEAHPKFKEAYAEAKKANQKGR